MSLPLMKHIICQMKFLSKHLRHWRVLLGKCHFPSCQRKSMVVVNPFLVMNPPFRANVVWPSITNHSYQLPNGLKLWSWPVNRQILDCSQHDKTLTSWTAVQKTIFRPSLVWYFSSNPILWVILHLIFAAIQNWPTMNHKVPIFERPFRIQRCLGFHDLAVLVHDWRLSTSVFLESWIWIGCRNYKQTSWRMVFIYIYNIIQLYIYIYYIRGV